MPRSRPSPGPSSKPIAGSPCPRDCSIAVRATGGAAAARCSGWQPTCYRGSRGDDPGPAMGAPSPRAGRLTGWQHGWMPLPHAAHDSVHGLALGDAFGERWFFVPPTRVRHHLATRRRPDDEARWHWTDDTAMALELLRVLHAAGTVDQDRLAEAFAAAYRADPYRGYGPGMHELLGRLAAEEA